MSYTFYEYSKCQSCVKARKWLEAHKIKFESLPLVDTPPTLNQLKDCIEKSGLDIKKFFNTSGVMYKELKLSEKLPALSQQEQLKLLASHGKLIKRPLLIGKDLVLVGFKETDYQKLL